jgi:hypothetical protein
LTVGYHRKGCDSHDGAITEAAVRAKNVTEDPGPFDGDQIELFPSGSSSSVALLWHDATQGAHHLASHPVIHDRNDRSSGAYLVRRLARVLR